MWKAIKPDPESPRLYAESADAGVIEFNLTSSGYVKLAQKSREWWWSAEVYSRARAVAPDVWAVQPSAAQAKALPYLVEARYMVLTAELLRRKEAVLQRLSKLQAMRAESSGSRGSDDPSAAETEAIRAQLDTINRQLRICIPNHPDAEHPLQPEPAPAPAPPSMPRPEPTIPTATHG